MNKGDSYVYLTVKRGLDVIGGAVGCMATVVLILCIKISYIKDGDFGSIFFVQERIGKDGEMFKIYKFRSMIPNAEAELERLMEEDALIREEYLTNKKLRDDPRSTKIGKIIRQKSLDEFPQFLNVFLGSMSLVGPRPYLEREIPDMGEAYDEIIKVKPGITGPWQTGGRNDLSFKIRLEKDVEYVHNHNTFGDIKMIFFTVFQMFGGKGAF